MYVIATPENLELFKFGSLSVDDNIGGLRMFDFISLSETIWRFSNENSEELGIVLVE